MPQAMAVPEAPGLKDVAVLHELLKHIVENVEELKGWRGKGRAVTNDTVGIEASKWTVLNQVRTPLGGTTNAAVGVPTYTEYINLINDVQQLMVDVGTIQSVLNKLLVNMRK